jgi:hypothetical protein
MKKRVIWIIFALVAGAFGAGRWVGGYQIVRADSDDAQIDVRQIDGSSSLVVYYPGTTKMFVYQPFAGQPTWPCAYSIQLSTPGGTVARKACGSGW